MKPSFTAATNLNLLHPFSRFYPDFKPKIVPKMSDKIPSIRNPIPFGMYHDITINTTPAIHRATVGCLVFWRTTQVYTCFICHGKTYFRHWQSLCRWSERL